MALSWPQHDPNSNRDYNIDWSFALNPGETLTEATFTFPDENDDPGNPGHDISGLVMGAYGYAGALATVYLSGGVIGKIGTVYCTVQTSDGRQLTQTVQVPIGTN